MTEWAIKLLRIRRWVMRSKKPADPQWAASVGGNLWRTDDDIRDDYYTMAELRFGQNGLEQFAGPGHWNDPEARSR
jgi:hypothetical protein